ncbi:MAG: GNAT family N-acetyltransferase, partial [Thermoguttaceae bacterium]
MPKFEIRAAGKSDVAILLELIRGIAEYEKMTDELVATEELLSEWLFEKRVAEALLAFEDGEPVGYAL